MKLSIVTLLSIVIAACSPKAHLAEIDLFTRKVKCALANADLPPIQLAEKCAFDAQDLQDYADIVETQKKAVAMARESAVAAKKCP